ncbi:MAG TPA: glucose-6-phosphate dehydrogenase [Nocardioides sp.]|nr:glucose-6-phosphate dehydrogenase [Nocardioides sp.]
MSPAGRPDNPLRDPQDRRLPRIAGPCGMVIFGVTGDLSRKKLMPAIYDLASRGLLPPGFSVVGFARREWADQDFAQIVHDAVKEHSRTEFREEVWRQLAEGIRFVPGDFSDDLAFESLRQTILDLDRVRGTGGNHAFYLSIPPRFFPDVVGQLKEHGLAEQGSDSWRRVVIEKPFGSNLETARELNAVVSEVFPSESVFRIDHYLGKETVQNILAMRFANSMFEPIWNSNYVDHVQITMAEDIGIGGRAGYYDGIGAARDVIQNHLLQLMALIAMEEPTSFDAHNLRIEKQKVLESVVLPRRLDLHTARGQYTEGWAGGQKVPGYTDETDIPTSSHTETYAALRLDIENRRWAGVPFYLRTGKRLGRRVTEVAVVFKKAPHLPFGETSTEELSNNALVIRVQPDEGVTLRFGSKVPGTQMEIRDVNMDFQYGGSFTESSPEAYERLILDVLLGEPPLFPRHEEVELSWKILDPVIEYWAEHGKPDTYPAGTWGPESAEKMLARDERTWRRP